MVDHLAKTLSGVCDGQSVYSVLTILDFKKTKKKIIAVFGQGHAQGQGAIGEHLRFQPLSKQFFTGIFFKYNI